MAAGLKFSPYFFIAAAFILSYNFYYIYNLTLKNKRLRKSVEFCRESQAVSRRSHKTFKDLTEKKLSAKEAKITELDNQVMSKHAALGNLQATLAQMKKTVASKNGEIEELQRIGSSHKKDIEHLRVSLLKSKESLNSLSGKTDHLMSVLSNKEATLKQQTEQLMNETNQRHRDKMVYAEKLRRYIEKNKELLGQVETLTKANNAIREGIKEKIRSMSVNKDSSNTSAQNVTFVQNECDVKALIQMYETETRSKFITYYSDKSFGSNDSYKVTEQLQRHTENKTEPVPNRIAMTSPAASTQSQPRNGTEPGPPFKETSTSGRRRRKFF